MSTFLSVALLVVSLALSPTYGLDNGACNTPPMGWSTWNAFHAQITEEKLRPIAQAMSKSGMVAAGYKYFNIDDAWPKSQREPNGTLLPDPKKFPDMPGFSKYLKNELNLTLGIYTAHSNKTCQGFPGSLGYETIDANLWASWGVGFVKNDWCDWRKGKPGTDDLKAFNALRDALNATGVPMVYSIHWNYASQPSPTGKIPLPDTANMWRIGGDISPNWAAILRLIDTNIPLAYAAGPGSWNDADMLEVGNGKLTTNEDRAHFTMWCMMASPLIAGNNLAEMTKETIEILTNKHAIAVDQDPLTIQGTVLATGNQTQVWGKPLAGDVATFALTFLNRDCQGNCTMSFDLGKLMPHPVHKSCASMSYEAFNLWEDAKSMGVQKGTMTVKVPYHDVLMLKLVCK